MVKHSERLIKTEFTNTDMKVDDALDRDGLTGGSKEAGEVGRLYAISPGRRYYFLVNDSGASAGVEDESDGVHLRCLESDGCT